MLRGLAWDDSRMLIRWNTLLIAVAVAGGLVLIENSHRIDTTTPDDEVVANAPTDCTVVDAVGHGTTTGQSEENAAPALPPACQER